MMKKQFLLMGVFILILIPVHVYSGTFFEVEKRTSDPYIAEFGGFRSIFANPAGISGQSGFDLTVNLGANGYVRDLVTVLATTKMGFLIKGFGLGLYVHSANDLSLDLKEDIFVMESFLLEWGTIVGFGFDIPETAISLGASFNYGTLIKSDERYELPSMDTIFSFLDSHIKYGYIWGVDVGMIWKPTPSWNLGIVLNDIVGLNQLDVPYSASGLSALFNDDADRGSPIDEYEFSLDMDVGAVFRPKSNGIRPEFSLDFQDLIGYAHDVSSNGDSSSDALYRMLDHVRIGAKFTSFDMLKFGLQYDNRYWSIGLGLDLSFIELYGEAKIHDKFYLEGNTHDSAVPLGIDIMARLYF